MTQFKSWFSFLMVVTNPLENLLPTSDTKQDHVLVVSHPHCLLPFDLHSITLTSRFISSTWLLPTKVHYASPILTYEQQDQVLISDQSYAQVCYLNNVVFVNCCLTSWWWWWWCLKSWVLCTAKYSHMSDILSVQVKLFRSSRSTLMIVSYVIQWCFLNWCTHSIKWQPCLWRTGHNVIKWLWPISGQYSNIRWSLFRSLKG